MRKHIIVIGIVIGVVLLIVAAREYPGGSPADSGSIGYQWSNNYISNLLNPVAVNGAANTSRPWAIGGVLLLSGCFGLFFLSFSGKIVFKSAANVIRYAGLAATFFAFLTVIPSLHDATVMVSSILTLLCFFYITVMLLKSRLHLLKWMSVFFLVTFYFVTYMYFTRSYLEFLPLMQKVIFMMKIVWVISLEYFTDKEDFEHIVSKPSLKNVL